MRPRKRGEPKKCRATPKKIEIRIEKDRQDFSIATVSVSDLFLFGFFCGVAIDGNSMVAVKKDPKIMGFPYLGEFTTGSSERIAKFESPLKT